jgi:hypothetical protein
MQNYIITATEIQQYIAKINFQKEINNIYVLCRIFIVDEDLKLPGKNVYLFCQYLKVEG